MADPQAGASWGAIGAAIGGIAALAAAIFGWLSSRKKSDVDETSQVLVAWKELVAAHEKTVERLTGEMQSMQNRLTAAESRITELEHERRLDRQRIRVLEEENASIKDENAGLKRSIAQNSQSTAHMLERLSVPSDDPVDDVIEKLDRAGHNLRGGSNE